MNTLIAALSLVALSCSKGEDQAETVLVELRALSKSICACEDTTCLGTYMPKMTEVVTKGAERFSGATSEQTEEARAVNLAAAACIDSIRSKAIPKAEADALASAAAKTIARHSKSICKCQNKACVSEKRALWKQDMKIYTTGPTVVLEHTTFTKAVAKATKRTEACIAKIR